MASPRVIDMVDNQPLESPDADVTRVRLPNIKENEMFGIADQLLGASKIKVMCEDGVSRVGRIPGKIKKRMWIREGDLLIVSVWDFQPDKCDVRLTVAVNKCNGIARNICNKYGMTVAACISVLQDVALFNIANTVNP